MEHNNLDKGDKIKALLYARENFINGIYKACDIGLDNFSEINKKDTFFLETLIMKADLADKIIKEAELRGEDTTNPEVIKRISEIIKVAGTPIHKAEIVAVVIFDTLTYMLFYGIALGIWGIIFKKILIFSLSGIIIGFIISLLFFVPKVMTQRTKEMVFNVSCAVGLIFGGIVAIINILGMISLIFFSIVNIKINLTGIVGLIVGLISTTFAISGINNTIKEHNHSKHSC